MKKKLSINTPIVNTYTSYGAIFSILPQSAFPWIMNNFIQLNFVYNWDMATFDYHRMFMSNCPSIGFYEETGKTLSSRGENGLKDAIVMGIEREEYLFIYADRFFLKVAEEYQKEHMPHEIFIYGYDLTENIVYVADNLLYGKFIFTTCSFEELTEAYSNINLEYEFMHTIRYLKVHENTYCKLNINQIMRGLDSYLNSYESFDIVGNDSKVDYGVSVYDTILNIIAHANGEGVDIRFFHLLYEHKLLMEMRVRYLIEHNYISQGEIDIEEFEKLKITVFTLRNMVLKYNFLKSKDLLDRIYNKLVKIRKEDYKLLSYLLWRLRVNQKKI